MTVSTLAPRARRKMKPPTPADAVTQYAMDVLAGRIVAGKYVRLACERHISDLATGSERGLTWDAHEAEKSIDFYHLLHHYQGREDLIVLDPWQKFIVGSAFGWKRADGSRRFRIVYVEVAAKNGKSTMAGGAGLRLAFFDGEPGAQVYAAATKREQAKIPWNAAVQMVRKSPSFQAQIQVFMGSLAQTSSASFFQPLGRDSDSDQGINPHGAIIDELHVHDSRDLLDNIEKAAAVRRQPMIWKITTAGVLRESVWWEERSDALSVLQGRATDDSLFAVIYTLDEGDDPFDEAVWPKANPGLGSSVQIDHLRERSAKAQRSPGALAAYLRYNMNVPTAVSTRALDIKEWDASAADPIIPQGATVYLGMDLAVTTDLTAVVVAHRDVEGYYNVECHFFCPSDGIERRSRTDNVPYADWARDGFLTPTSPGTTDYDFVLARILEIAEKYAIAEIAFDPFNSSQISVDLQGAGLNMVKVSQYHAGLAPSWHELEKVILDHKLRHGGNPILRWMAGNVEVETDAAGNQKPSKRHSTERIDGMVALTMAVGRWVVNGEPAVWTAA